MFDPNSGLVAVTVHVPLAKMGAFHAAIAALHGTTAPAAITAKPAPEFRGSTAEEAKVVETADKSNVAEKVAEPATGDDTVDAEGWPWNAEMHASTKGTTKAGLWRMKVGVSRPDPKPGFSKVDAAADAAKPAAGGTVSTAPAADEDDEFAAFRTAAAASEKAPASVPARTWSDADLSALCNQAAGKLGDPTPIRELITEYLPEGAVQHSRNIAADQREPFAKALEAKAGIEFAG